MPAWEAHWAAPTPACPFLGGAVIALRIGPELAQVRVPPEIEHVVARFHAVCGPNAGVVYVGLDGPGPRVLRLDPYSLPTIVRAHPVAAAWFAQVLQDMN